MFLISFGICLLMMGLAVLCARLCTKDGYIRNIYTYGLAALKAAGVDAAVLELKKYEALVAMSNGRASKIIVPTDTVNMAKQNVVFSETTGLGDATPAAPVEKPVKKADPCCE